MRVHFSIGINFEVDREPEPAHPDLDSQTERATIGFQPNPEDDE